MAELANILENESTSPRGPDLFYAASVSSRALGKPEGVRVRVPLQLPHEGRLVSRAQGVGEQGERVTLHLPSQLPKGARLRLRGQGGLRKGASPGDLFVDVEILLPPSRVVTAIVGTAVLAVVGTLLGLFYG